MTSLQFVLICYGIFAAICTVTTIIIMHLKKKVFNKNSANYKTQQTD